MLTLFRFQGITSSTLIQSLTTERKTESLGRLALGSEINRDISGLEFINNLHCMGPSEEALLSSIIWPHLIIRPNSVLAAAEAQS